MPYNLVHMCKGSIVLKANFHWRHFHQHMKNKIYLHKYSGACFLVSQARICSICHMNKTNRICSIHLYNLFGEKIPNRQKECISWFWWYISKFAYADKGNPCHWLWRSLILNERGFFFQLTCGFCTVLLNTRP